MPATNQNLEHWAGNARTLQFGLVKDRNGDLVDLTGASATWTMAQKNTSPVSGVIVEKSTIDPAVEQSPGIFCLLVYLHKDDTKLGLVLPPVQMLTQAIVRFTLDIVAKVENRTTQKISRKSIFRPLCCCVAFQATKGMCDRFWINRHGPPHRRAQNASAALRIFVRHLKKTFATNIDH